ncbi:MAG: hypothetical protein NC320_03190 [Clostridium sp.]|nr:hypothetical protein [Clostridium sp.]
MKQKIQAGALKDIADSFKKISQAFFKFMDNLSKKGVEVTKEEELPDGSYKYWCVFEGKEFGIMIKPIKDEDDENTGKIDLLVSYDKKDSVFENINENDVGKKVNEVLSKYGIDFIEDTNSSKKLRVTLQKVTSAKESVINLTAVTANYDIYEANETLETVLDNEEFLDKISEEPVSFEITDNEDEFDIQSISEFDITDAMDSVKRTYENFCSEARNLVDMLEFYYSNFSYEEQLEADRLIDGINNCSTGALGGF